MVLVLYQRSLLWMLACSSVDSQACTACNIGKCRAVDGNYGHRHRHRGAVWGAVDSDGAMGWAICGGGVQRRKSLHLLEFDRRNEQRVRTYYGDSEPFACVGVEPAHKVVLRAAM